MTKDEALQVRKAAYLSAQDSALNDFGNGMFDDGVASVPPSVGGDPSKIYSEEELQGKLAEQKAADDALLDQAKADDQKALEDAVAVVQAKLDEAQAQLVDMTAKYGAEHDAVQGFKDKVQGLQEALNKIIGLITPDVQPEPTPEQPA